MKILLIHPPITDNERYGSFAKAGSILPPLGLLYISSYLRKNGYNHVSLVDGLRDNTGFSELNNRVQEFCPSVVGITATTLTYQRATETARLIKQIDPKIITILGGPHATAYKDDIINEEDAFDCTVTGEGEETMLQLVQALDEGRSWRDIPGTICRDGRETKVNDSRPFIANLDDVPFPDRDLLVRGWQHFYRPNLARVNREPVTSMITSRGCPYQCTFCDRNTFGRKFRSHSAEYVVSEMEMLVEEYGIREICIEDDTFTINKERVAEICESLIRKDLDLTWSCLARVDTVDKQLLSLMKRAGCWLIAYGIESGNPHILKKMKKNIDLEKAKEVIKWSRQEKLDVRAFFVIGHPGETEETALETIRYAKSLPLLSVTFCLMTPIRNTEAYDMAISGEYGKFEVDFSQLSGHPTNPTFTPNGFSKESLMAYHRRAYREFFLRPVMVFRFLRNIRSFGHVRRYYRLLLAAKDVLLKS